MYIPYVLHRSLHMLCMVTHCSGPLLHQPTARWCKRMRNDCLINRSLVCLMISLLTAHSFNGMGPKPSFLCPLCSLLFFLSLLSLCNVWNFLLWSSAYQKQRLFSSDKSSGAFFGFPNYPYKSRSESWPVPAFMLQNVPAMAWTGNVQSCLTSPLPSAFYTLAEADTFYAIPSVSYYTPNA